MKWLTGQEVGFYATTPRKALEISIKHWWQNRTATREELNRFLATRSYSCWSAFHCGLCRFHRYDCRDCLVEDDCEEGNSYWGRAQIACDDYKRNRTKENFQAWQKAAKEMHLYLCSLRKKKE